jgi:predicted ATPase
MKKYVLTGAPSVGKTTVLNILAARGYEIVNEAADEIIREEREKPNKGSLSLGNVKSFQELVAARQLELEAKAQSEIVFLDRGITDGYAFCKLAQVDVPAIIVDESRGRYEAVFFLESLGTYEYDGVRTGDLNGANQISPLIKEAYQFFGYSLVSVPVATPEERADFILKFLSRLKA